jgi:hypothetical protein
VEDTKAYYLTFEADVGALERLLLSWQDLGEFGQFHFAPDHYRSRRGDGLAPPISVPRRHPELVLCSRFQVECIKRVNGGNAHLPEKNIKISYVDVEGHLYGKYKWHERELRGLIHAPATAERRNSSHFTYKHKYTHICMYVLSLLN